MKYDDGNVETTVDSLSLSLSNSNSKRDKVLFGLQRDFDWLVEIRIIDSQLYLLKSD